LYVSVLISIAVYGVDIFTAVNLLAFDRWSGQIKPYIPMKYSRWIFAACIILSFIFLFFRWLRAIRVMKRGGVAESYLDPLALYIQSLRMGKEGRGWKRFLVFAELSKGKKGADYVALFTYYSFEGMLQMALRSPSMLTLVVAWLRILFAEGPRQVINALTLYTVMQLNLIPVGDNAAKDGHTPIVQFFVNVGLLADKSGRQQAVILFGMLFTLVIWVITLINLMVAVVLYLVFLFHHIPSTDGGLSGYCRRKINQSMDKIVKTKVEKALRKENALRARQEGGVAQGAMKRQPTLPNLDPFDPTSEEKPPMLSRQTTQATLPEYSSRPGTAAGSAYTSPSDLERQPTLPDLASAEFRPQPPTRVNTYASSTSWASHGSSAPLMAGAGGMGYGEPGRSPSPVGVSPLESYNSRSGVNRSYTGHSQATQRSYTPANSQRAGIGQSGYSTPGSYQMEPVSRSGTAMSGRQTPGVGPSPVESYGRRTPLEQNNPYFPPNSDYSAPGSTATLPRSITPGIAPIRTHTPRAASSTRSITPAPPSSSRSYGPAPPLPEMPTHPSSSVEGYQSYNAGPHAHAQSSSSSSSFAPHAPYRSFTQPIQAPNQQYSQPTSRQPTPSPRPGTAPPTNRQTKPVADEVMEDIMNGY
jgi:Fungal potassium channel